MTVLQRFEEKFVPEPNTGCWLWTGACNSQGYGFFNLEKHVGAHRASYEIYKGPIPKGHDVMHSCDMPSCVNPNHLSTGTRKQNVKDMLDKKRAWQQLRTHCPSGHSYEDHGFKGPQGWRYCNVCQRTKHLKRKRSLPLGKQSK